MFKARVSGNFTPFSINQDAESPLAMDVTLMADETIADSRRNIYESIVRPDRVSLIAVYGTAA